jgi:VCBS repeat-containing protein
MKRAFGVIVIMLLVTVILLSGTVYAASYDQIAKLTAPDGAANDHFGFAVSISGDTLVVGAIDDNNQGSAYVFERNQGGEDNWGQVKKLTAPDGIAGDAFGVGVSISGNTIVIGASGLYNTGQAYVFDRNLGGANNWGLVKKLTTSDGAAGDRFGYAVSIYGDTIAIGAPYSDGTVPTSGSAYVFERNNGGVNNWGQVKKLTAADGSFDDVFGLILSVDGDILVVGAIYDDDNGVNSGSAYVFGRNQGGANSWGQVKKLTASDGAENDMFGGVSVSGDIIVCTSYEDDDNGTNSGSAYVFERNQGGTDNWGQVKKLTASDGAAYDDFGSQVSNSGETIIVSSYIDDDKGIDSGSAYVFERNNGGANNWGQVKKLTASDGAMGDKFGWAVSISGCTIVVSAAYDDDKGINSGSAYIFGNHSPVAGNDTAITLEDTTVNGNVLTNDTDVDGDILTAIKVTDPAHGALILNTNGSFTYTPAINYNGTDSFTYKANDGQLDSNIATVSITVRPVNDPPVIQSITVNPNQLWPPNKKPVDVKVTVVANDPDGVNDISRITYSVTDEYGIYNVAETNLPANGTISLIADRDGNDKDGRIYTIAIRVYDTGGLFDQRSVNVIVPHDQGK